MKPSGREWAQDCGARAAPALLLPWAFPDQSWWPEHPCGKGHSPTLGHLHPAQFLVTSFGDDFGGVSLGFWCAPKLPIPARVGTGSSSPAQTHDVTPQGPVTSKSGTGCHVTITPWCRHLCPLPPKYTCPGCCCQQWLTRCQQRGAKGTRLYGEHYATVPTPVPATCAPPICQSPQPTASGLVGEWGEGEAGEHRASQACAFFGFLRE